MNKIKIWRKNAMLTQEGMAIEMDIPKRTIENWEGEVSSPPAWAERLIIEELKRITARKFEERAEKTMAGLKSDENGERPAASWAVITRKRDGYGDEFVDICKDINDAIFECELQKEQYPEDEHIAAYVLCNREGDKLTPYYCDKNGQIWSDYDFLTLE